MATRPLRHLWLALVVLVLAEAARAGSRPPLAARVLLAPVRYLRDRGQDLMDAVEVNVGVSQLKGGPSRYVKLDLKYGVHFFGFGDDVRTWRAGNIDRRAGYWRELDTELSLFPLSLLAWPVHHAAQLWGWQGLARDARFVARAGTKGIQYVDRKELNGDPAFLWKDTVEGYRHTCWGDSFPIGAEVHALLGARLMVRPLQLADFAVGLVGLDMDPWLTKRP
ncbi:MAG: hypothetical protein ACLF0G_12770 [Candidatus Brocadiia bacterium]